MMNIETKEEENKQSLIERMGEELGLILYELKWEVHGLFLKWREYDELFNTNPLRLDLLNEAAPYFFDHIKDIVEDDILLHISRLTDKRGDRSGKYEYCTIQRLRSLIKERELEGIEEKELDDKEKDKIASEKTQPLNNLLNEVKEKAEPIREHRDRRIAHKEFPSTSRNVRPPEKPFFADMKNAIEAIAKVLKYVWKHYLGETIIFKQITMSGWAKSLLYVIDSGLKANEANQKRWAKLDFQQNDLDTPDWAKSDPDKI